MDINSTTVLYIKMFQSTTVLIKSESSQETKIDHLCPAQVLCVRNCQIQKDYTYTNNTSE